MSGAGIVAFAALAPRAVPVHSHAGVPPAPHDLWTSWELGPLVGLAAFAWLYGRGVGRVWRRAGRGRGVATSEAAAGTAAVLVLALALVSPLAGLAEALFSAHMLQHLLLLAVAAPLLARSRAALAMLRGLPKSERRRFGRLHRRAGLPRTIVRRLAGRPAAWVVYGGIVWLWHAPALYQAALRHELLHASEHTLLLATALLFWWSVLGHRSPRHHGPSILSLFTMGLLLGALGALITFSTVVWYPAYAATAPGWGLSALEDQQLAGLVMWIPPTVVHLGVALWLFATWLSWVEREGSWSPGTDREAEGVGAPP